MPLSEAVQQACVNPHEKNALVGVQAVFCEKGEKGVLAISADNDRTNYAAAKLFLPDEYAPVFPRLHSVPHFTALPGADESACLFAFLCYLHDKFGG